MALLAAACLLPGSAFAVERRPLSESFGTDGTSGTSFERPEELAFDQGNKRLYVLDEETRQIHGYDAASAGTHTPLGGSFPLSAPGGFFDDIGVDSSSHNLYYASVGESKLFGFDESGSSLSGFPVPGQNFPCGATTDSAGNVWVAQGNEGKLRKYSPAGALLETITIGGEPCDLAIDSQNNIYVAFFFGGTTEYTAASNYTTSVPIDAETTNAVAVDPSTDEVYVAHFNHISVYKADGSFFYEFGKSIAGGEAEFNGVAIDQATEELYVSSGREREVLVFGPPLPFPLVTTDGADAVTATGATLHGTVNPKGETLTDCHFEFVPASQFFNSGYTNVTPAQEAPCVPAAGSIPADSSSHAVDAEVSGLSTASTYHYRLVASNTSGTTDGLDRHLTTTSSSPLIEEEEVEAVGSNEAIVSAKINPRGGETTYHLEYGTTSAYGQSTSESPPFGSPTDRTPHTVSAHVSGLALGAAYHFRFVATNSAGTVDGADATFSTYPATNPAFGACPNEQFRTGAGSRLPDCRAYEQASPIDKHGSDAKASIGIVAASSFGDRVTFIANGGLPTSGGLSDISPFLASRDVDGWSTDGLLPLLDPGFVGQVIGWTEDLSTTLTSAPGPGNVGQALYLRDNTTGASELVVSGPANLFPTLAGFAADDSSQLIFETGAQLLPDAPAGVSNLYDVDHGNLTLVGRVPAGPATSCDDEAGPACVPAAQGAFATPSYAKNAISSDGSKVFFTSSNVGQLYMREDGVRTVRISASQRTTPDPSGQKPAVRVASSPDGSKVLFLSCEKLTDDSTAVSTGEPSCDTTHFEPGEGFVPDQGLDLYSYDTDSGELADLTVDHNAGDLLGAEVGGVLGASEDGSYVYFAAGGVLAPGASPSRRGGCHQFGPTPSCNLYLYHDGDITFIARVAGGDESSWEGAPSNERKNARVSADGKIALFRSFVNLTGQNNVSVACGSLGNKGPCGEFFRYSAPDEKLVCVSCMGTNTRPTGEAALGRAGRFITQSEHFLILARNLSNNGSRAFFESPDPLVLADTNGVSDVYEWEAKGTGSCESESQNGGCVYLISSGTNPQPSQFVDASANGDHVFFTTYEQLVPTDRDQLSDVYDAGVGSGLAAQHVLTPPTCSTAACQANPAPPPKPNLSSAALSGQGNVHRSPAARKCPKGKRKVRRAGKVSCQSAGKHSKRHGNRGGAK